ncbi:MAG: helix-turn-helix domain-containing protein [Chitinophagaceae bacterium]|jgi:transcriptional regulator with XRE-family HTH domain
MANIKELRTKKGLTQQQLADETGITLRTIQRIENGEVNPSLHSLNNLSRVLNTDLSILNQKEETKPYEFNFTFKITDMNQFLTDLKILVKNHWKIITLIVLIVWLATSYTEIKAGIMDGWNGK